MLFRASPLDTSENDVTQMTLRDLNCFVRKLKIQRLVSTLNFTSIQWLTLGDTGGAIILNNLSIDNRLSHLNPSRPERAGD